MTGIWRLLVYAALVGIMTGGSVNTASAQEPPPNLCSGPFESSKDYCLMLGYLSFGNGSAINEICKQQTDCLLNNCIREDCWLNTTPCEYDFFRACGENFFADGKTALICTVAMFYQGKRMELQPEYPEDCDGDAINKCPSGICYGCVEEKSWCGCNWDSRECPASECCSYTSPPVCGRVDSGYSGWGRCYEFNYNQWTHCGFKAGYSYADHCPFYQDTCPPIERPQTMQCGDTFNGIEGIDFIRDYSFDGGPAYNPKVSCHYCKGNVFLEWKPTSEDCDQSNL